MIKIGVYKKPVFLALVLCGTILAAGCRNYLSEGLSLMETSSGREAVRSASFSQELSKEYEALAAFAETSGKMAGAGSYFRSKAAKAARGDMVDPDSLNAAELPAHARDSLTDARDQLLQALARANTPENATLLAMAQVKFDCWLLYQNLSRKQDGYIGCREAFHQAMSYISVPEFAPERPVITAPGRASHYEVAFEDDSAMLSPEAHEIVERVASQLASSPGSSLLMVGHSKSKANETDTSNQSVRRTIAVRNALYTYGVDPDAIEVKFENTGSPLEIEIHVVPAGVDKSS